MEPAECRAVIRLYLKGSTPKKTFDEINETYGDDALSYELVKRSHREFKHGPKTVETASRPGRLSSAIVEASVRQVEAAILEDRRIIVRQLAQDWYRLADNLQIDGVVFIGSQQLQDLTYGSKKLVVHTSGHTQIRLSG
uniref:Uncharacterized protein LOC102808255 n=1 Tax=Saccoglossus kowalevskii TaxID=10224 RepID=A0ABM0MZ93_SACKO|nr:PREDICTED: uncharacterized protein LOC102808255 [Saccoglossus kowalevskii]